jgi:hypothetical protein
MSRDEDLLAEARRVAARIDHHYAMARTNVDDQMGHVNAARALEPRLRELTAQLGL